MKKTMIVSLLVVFITIMGLGLGVDNTETSVVKSKNSCTVKVTYRSGSAASGVRVVGDVCGGISCSGHTKAVYTDSDGYATVEWSDGCRLCYIYVNGTSHKGDFRDGGSYTFTK